MLEEQVGRLPRPDGEVLLNLCPLLSTEGWIGQHDVVTVLLLDVRQVLGQGVRVDDVWGVDAMQDHVHDPDDIGQTLLLLAVEGPLLKGLGLRDGEPLLLLEELEGLAQEPCRPHRWIVDALADLGLDHLDDGPDEGPGGVVLAAVAPGIAHVLDLGFIQVGEFVLLVLGLEPEFVHQVDDLPEVVATLDAVLDLPKDFPDFVFDGVRPAGLLLEAVQVGEQLLVHEVPEVIPRQGLVVVQIPVPALRRSPGPPPVGLVQDEVEGLAIKGRLRGLVFLQGV